MIQRVLMLVGEFPPVLGGIADYAKRLATALVQSGVAVTIVTTRSPRLQEEATEDGVRVLRVMKGWRMRELPTLLRVIREEGTGAVVHIQYPAVAFRRNPMINLLPGVLRRRRFGPPVAVTFHDARVMRPRWRARTAPMLAGAHAVVHVDPPDGACLARWTWANDPLTRCIPIGASIEPQPMAEGDRTRWREDLDLSGPDPIVAFFGMLYPHKGLAELVAAIAQLRSGGRRLRLLVIGDFDRPSPFERRVEELFRVGARDRWLVWLRGADAEKVSRALWAADLAALPYHSGAGSNRSSLLSALAHGLPVVTTRGPATPPDFEDHFPVSLVPVRDASALAGGIDSLLGSDLVSLGEAGRRRAAVIPSWEEVASRHLDLYACLWRQGRAA